MSLRDSDADILRMYGFTEREIREFANATTPSGELQPLIDLNSEVWQATILARQKTIGQITKQYLKDTRRRITKQRRDVIINAYYTTNKNSSPWDWLKIEYTQRKVKDFDDRSVKQARAEARKRAAAWKRQWKS